VWAVLALAGCGGGGGGGSGAGNGGGDSSGSTRDPVAAQALVDEGVAELEESLSSGNPPPFATLADISDLFDQAARLDGENPTAAFFSALAQVFLFLDSPAAKSFLVKLGWDNFRENEAEWGNFIAALGSAVGSVTGTAGFTPPVDESGGAITFGEDGVTFAEIIEFLTVTVPTRLHSSVNLLGTIPPGWSFTLNFSVDTGGGAEDYSITVNYTDAMAIRAVFAGAESVLAAPGIWTYTGLDAFLAAPENKDQEGNITDVALQTYFASEDQPLARNAAGVERLLTALSAFLESFDTALLAQQSDTSGHLLSVTGLLADQGRYDREAVVINYGLDAFRLTAADLRTALTADGAMGIYQPVAFIKDFAVCDPLAGDEQDPDLSPQNDNSRPVLALEEPPPALPLSPDTPEGSLSSEGMTPQSDGAYYFRITLTAPANVSIWSEGAETNAVVGYEDTTGAVVPWDFDEDSGGGGNFGISIAAVYMADTVMAGIPSKDITLYVAVQSLNGDPFTLKAATDLNQTWPPSAPIFLKGGGGRNFKSETWKIASVTKANIGNLIRLAAEAFDLSKRKTLLLDDPSTQDSVESFTRLDFDKETLRSKISAVLPEVTFGDGMQEQGDIYIVDAVQEITVEGVLDWTPTLHSSDGPEFCAYPKDLMPARLFTGGHSIAVGF
jgi:hypothetical protein